MRNHTVVKHLLSCSAKDEHFCQVCRGISWGEERRIGEEETTLSIWVPISTTVIHWGKFILHFHVLKFNRAKILYLLLSIGAEGYKVERSHESEMLMWEYHDLILTHSPMSFSSPSFKYDLYVLALSWGESVT